MSKSDALDKLIIELDHSIRYDIPDLKNKMKMLLRLAKKAKKELK